MECLGKLSPSCLLRQSQLRGKPSQLQRSLFQLSMTSFQLSMTSSEGTLSLLVQSLLSFFVAAHLESLLGAAAFGDVQANPIHPRDSAISIAVGAAQAVYPPDGPIWSHGS